MAASRVQLNSLPAGTVLRAGSFLPASGASAFVYSHGSTTPVDVYVAETGGATLAQPLTADSNGMLPGWVLPAQDLDVVATYGGQTSPAQQAEPAVAGAPVAGAELTTHKDQPGGYAGLDGGGLLKTSELPPSVAIVSSPNAFTATQTITPGAAADGLDVTMPHAFTGAGITVSGPQDGSGTGNQISVNLYGTGSGVDIKGWTPNAAGGATNGGIPLAIHQYGTPPAGGALARFDNTGAGINLILASTENSSNAPGTWGNGDAIDFYTYNGYTTFTAAATVTGTNTVTDTTNAPFLPNCVGKPIIVAAVKTKIATYVSASQVTTTDAVLNASGVTYSLPLKANVGQLAQITLDVTPTGNGGNGLLRFVNLQTGTHARSADPWSFENTLDNGSVALQVVQAAGTSGAAAFLVNNKGNTGLLLALQSNATNKFLVDNNGSVTRMGNLTMTGTGTDGNMIFGTVTGTKIGSVGGAAGQKMAFWGVAPIVQPVLATGAGHTVDDVITTLQALGLVRQV